MMKIVLACVFLAVVVTALPADDAVPEAELYTQRVQLHKEASADISTMLETGKTKDACASLADATAKEITDSVGASQKVMNAVPKGSACAKEGQQAVDSAKKALDDAKAKEAAAKKAGNSAKSAPVKFADISITAVKTNDCSAFHADPAYISAKKTADAAAKKQAEAGGQSKAAQTAYDNAVAAQKAAIKACACHTRWQHDQAKKAADKSNSSENAKAWSKSHMMKCVLAGTSASSCKVPPTPKVTVPALEEPAKSMKGCSAPTPPPTPAPTKNPTKAPTKAPLSCITEGKTTHNAGVVNIHPPSGYALTGVGMTNSYRKWDAKAGFEQMYPAGASTAAYASCDMGFGPGKLTCYATYCKGLTCQTKSKKSNVGEAGPVESPYLDSGYTMTGGGIYNHHRKWDAGSKFVKSAPHSDRTWGGQIGGHPKGGHWDTYSIGCKGLVCVTKMTAVQNNGNVLCPSGYVVTGCGVQNYDGWGIKSGFEDSKVEGNGCFCDTGFGPGRNKCYARCCKKE
jgi:hypothetical protein